MHYCSSSSSSGIDQSPRLVLAHAHVSIQCRSKHRIVHNVKCKVTCDVIGACDSSIDFKVKHEDQLD